MNDLAFEPQKKLNGFDFAGSLQDGLLIGISPIDGKKLDSVEASTTEGICRAIHRLQSLQPVWASLPLSERTMRLKKAARNMLRDRNTVLKLIRDESGKSEVESLMSEALGPLDQVNGWASIVAKAMQPRPMSLNPIAFPFKHANKRLIPRGIIGVITPWNFPLATFYRSVFPALLTGNATVVKPSEYTPRVADWFVSHLQEELKLRVLEVVHGQGEAGYTLINSGIDACVFTGSVETGRKVLAQCAKRMIPSSIELGGKDSAIVLADCNLSRTIAGITHWALHNAGQSCGAIEVALVDKHIADEFVALMSQKWYQLKTAADHSHIYDVPPTAHVRQLNIIESQVKNALENGAQLVCGGKRIGDGLCFEPTLLDHCNASMDVVREETFGPVLPIVRVDGIDEALRITNSCRYGLTASIWSKDTQRAQRIAERIDVGTVTINNHSLTGAVTKLPWSGRRESGYGVANSEYALQTFLRPRTVLVDRSKIPDLYWMPYDEILNQMGQVLSDVQIARIRNVWKFPLLLYQRVSNSRRFYSI